MTSIPASAIVSVIPQVISGGGNGLDINMLLLTTSTRLPIGGVYGFASAADVGAYFGSTSTEKALADVYFLGFDNSNIKPGNLLFTQYPASAVSSWLRGGNVSALTLTQLQALSGVLTITVNGSSKTSSTISLTAATSFSNAATIIAAAFTSPGFTVTYDSQSGGFLFTNSTTGASSTITVASGTLAAGLKLTAATGAIVSQGADAAVPATFMDAVVAQTTNWVTFTTVSDPDASGNTVKQEFAAWTNAQAKRFAYITGDTDVTPTQSSAASTSLGAIVKAANSDGTVPVWAATWAEAVKKAVFIGGTAASIDWEQTNGRITFAFKSQSGLTADVTNQTIANNLIANGYNFYGSYATANDQFVFLYPGLVSGVFDWLDAYINQIWLNNALQLANMTLLKEIKSVPYNAAGRALIQAAAADPIQAALNNGVIRAGVTLSNLQAAEVNNTAGIKIDDIITRQGWFYQVKDATAQVRSNRGSPPCTLWYTDGGSVHKLNIASVEIQ